ncbi:hypothetical protein Y600_6436 [Burkholderia pseudomallei MSHR3709]|nr:hypothetical protein Y600_6436 [Burkholderia pseudomallei MSHR3709]
MRATDSDASDVTPDVLRAFAAYRAAPRVIAQPDDTGAASVPSARGSPAPAWHVSSVSPAAACATIAAMLVAMSAAASVRLCDSAPSASAIWLPGSIAGAAAPAAIVAGRVCCGSKSPTNAEIVAIAAAMFACVSPPAARAVATTALEYGETTIVDGALAYTASRPSPSSVAAAPVASST